MMSRSAFEIIGVSEDCDDDLIIKRAYRELALKWHPDRTAEDNKEEAAEQMKQINDAYGLIRDQNSRDSYRATREMLRCQGEAFKAVPLFQVVPQYSWQNNGDRRKLQRQLTSSGASMAQKMSSCFENAIAIPGKLRVFSQNIGLEFIIELGQDVPPIKAKRCIVMNQLGHVKDGDFRWENHLELQEMMERIRPFLQDYEPQLDFSKLKSKLKKVQEIDIDESELVENQFGLAKKINRQIASMMFELIVQSIKTTRANRENIDQDAIRPDMTLQVEPDHPACDTKGTIMVEFDCVLIKYRFKDLDYVAFANLTTGECFGEFDPSFFTKAKVIAALSLM